MNNSFHLVFSANNKCNHNQSTLSIFKVQIEIKFFFKHDTELRDGYNYTAQPKIAFISGDICMYQGAAFKMRCIEIAFECALAFYFRFRFCNRTLSVNREWWC